MKIEDVVCPFCGCLCDDIIVEVENNRVVSVDNGCTICNAKFMSKNQLKKPMRRTDDGWEAISYDEAIDMAVDILLDADRPLLYGWSGTHGEAQCVGVHMNEILGGIIDNTSSVCHGPSVLAIQEVGHPGCTLGQVKNRADLIIYWGSNPDEAHPRHMSRYTTYADGYFLDNAFRERKVIVVDVRETETAKIADLFLKIKKGGDYAVFSALRAIVRGKGDVVPDSVAGIEKTMLEQLVTMCKEAKFGALFFGLGLTMTKGKYKNVRNAIELVDELSRHTKFTLTPMRGHWNVYGTNEVFTWMTGYPFAVDFCRGIAFYNPGETSAVDILGRHECDACLIVASDPGAHFPRQCVEYMAEIPTIVIDPYENLTTSVADLQIPVAVTGIDAEGTGYRMDGVPIHLKKVIEPELPDDTEVLTRIYDKLREARGV